MPRRADRLSFGSLASVVACWEGAALHRRSVRRRLANLVLACEKCNGDKSNALPAVAIVEAVLERDQSLLEEIAQAIQWSTQRERVVAAARGNYRGQPEGVPTWGGYRETVRFDIAFAPHGCKTVRLPEPAESGS